MIQVQEAQAKIIAHKSQVPAVRLPLAKAAGKILAAPVHAPVPSPVFDASAVDGYAFIFPENGRATHTPPFQLLVKGEIKAGDAPDAVLKAGEAVRIFTGAAVPATADTVVMQEFTENENGVLRVNDPGLKAGKNIRFAGEQIQAGGLALEKGTFLNAAAIGLLASLGVTEVDAAEFPRIGILITGDELAEPGTKLAPGQIYESNGAMLQSALDTEGFEGRYERCRDDLQAMQDQLQRLSESCPVLIITGGVSVGDYDFTRAALENIGFEVIFHKVSQKPGKPILFAKKGNVAAFGLPGNPRAAMVCWFEYVRPYLRACAGSTQPFLQQLTLPLAEAYRKRDTRAHFLAVKIDADGIRVLGGQNSHMLQSLSLADGLALIPGDQTESPAGALTEVHLVPRFR